MQPPCISLQLLVLPGMEAVLRQQACRDAVALISRCVCPQDYCLGHESPPDCTKLALLPDKGPLTLCLPKCKGLRQHERAITRQQGQPCAV